ncbi:MAG: T9SS type A sorting domain-containing protein, partial [Lewinella sp.]
LPDSNVNEPLSHGFVTFEIKLDGERSIGALIRNEADIYFDYNSAIRTNEVRSRIVEFLDEDQDGFFFYDECDDQNPSINPDRYDIPGNGIDENCDDQDTPVSTTSPLSGRLSVFPNPADQQLNLSFSDNRELVAQLYDLLGREHHQLVFRRNGRLPIGRLPAGTYLLKVTDGLKGETNIQRVIRR